jgi:hypothetical protein
MYSGDGYPQYPQYPAAPSQPMYPNTAYPGNPAPPSQPMYPGAMYSPYSQAPGATWKPAEQKQRPMGLIIGGVVTLVVVLVVALAVGIGALTQKPIAHTPGASATATAQSHIAYSDSLTDSPSGWAGDSHCFASGDGYHVASGYLCFAPAGDIADGSVTVAVKETSGPTNFPYGIAFRLASDQSHYEFDIDSNSKWVFFKWPQGQSQSNETRLQDYTANSAIHGGLNATNTLKVDFRGGTFTCWVNGVQVGVVNDSSALGSGTVALASGDGVNSVFTNLVVTN